MISFHSDIDIDFCVDIDFLGAHITLLPQLKRGEERRGMEEVFALISIFHHSGRQEYVAAKAENGTQESFWAQHWTLRLLSSVEVSMPTRCWVRGWSLRLCALDPPTLSATGVARRLSTGSAIIIGENGPKKKVDKMPGCG